MNVKPDFSGGSASLYRSDYYGWVQEQIAHLKARRFAALDLENLIDEVGDLGKAEIKELRSALRILLVHMLKWKHQPERRSRSWVLSIRNGQRGAMRSMRESPSLKPLRNGIVEDAYGDARLVAADETGLKLSTFPETCPFSWDEIMDETFTEGLFED
jgi:predicted DNA-binding ribbon-helix-helix protein